MFVTDFINQVDVKWCMNKERNEKLIKLYLKKMLKCKPKCGMSKRGRIKKLPKVILPDCVEL